MNNVKFVTGVNKVYRLAGNDWYAVEQDDDKVMLIDTDCEVAGEELRTSWSDTDDDNGQCILNYTNALADKYFAEIKYAIVPKDVNCKNGYGEGRGEIKEAYMWPMSAYNSSGTLGSGGSNYVTNSCAVAPAFNLAKSVIDHITEDGEIILKPVV